jgi:CRISPR system Cascade subunit CasD
VIRSLYLRLAAPVITWGGSRVTPRRVDTAKVPTRTALEGMLAGCLGVPRGDQYPEWLSGLIISARQEHAPRVATDFQTVGAGVNSVDYLDRMARMTGGKGPARKDLLPQVDPQGNAFIINRQHLQDTEFLVSIRPGAGQDPGLVDTLYAAVHDPVFSPYLGRKANVPTFPFLMGVGEASLLTEAPVIRRRRDADTREVTLYPISHTTETGTTLPGIPTLAKQEWMDWWADHTEREEAL